MDTKTVYQCDLNNVYVGEAISYESPLERNVFLLPAGCVEVAPPGLSLNEAAVWSGSTWTVVPDFRGQTWFSGKEPVVITTVGNPRESGLSPVPLDEPVTTVEPSIGELRVLKIRLIQETADKLLLAGARVNENLHIALDDGSRADLTAMAATATAAAAGVVTWPESYARGWITIENVRIPLPAPTDGLVLAAAAGDYYAGVVQNRRDLKDAALAAATKTDLDALDVGAGWPS